MCTAKHEYANSTGSRAGQVTVALGKLGLDLKHLCAEMSNDNFPFSWLLSYALVHADEQQEPKATDPPGAVHEEHCMFEMCMLARVS